MSKHTTIPNVMTRRVQLGTRMVACATLALLVARPSLSAAEPLEPSRLLVEQSHIAITGCEWVTSGTSAAGTPLVAVSCPSGTRIYDLTDPRSPVLRSTLTSWGAVETDGQLLFVGDEIVDMRNPSSPVVKTQLGGLAGVHNLSFDPDVRQLFAVHETMNAAVFLLDQYDPDSAPSTLYPDFHVADTFHDVVAFDAHLYTSEKEIYYFPFLGPSQTVVAVHGEGAGPGFLHTVNGTADHRFVITAREGASYVDPSFRYVADDTGIPLYGAQGDPIANCAEPYTCIAQSGITLYEIPPGPSPQTAVERGQFFLADDVAGSAHKPEVLGDYVYTPFYQAGLQVMRIDPAAASWRHQASFDTSTAAAGGQAGAFEVTVALGVDRVAVVDHDSGLWILQHITDARLAAYMAML